MTYEMTTAGAFAEHRPEVAGLAAPLHRGLALALALAADGLRDPEAARQYVGHMLGAVARELAGLAGIFMFPIYRPSFCSAGA